MSATENTVDITDAPHNEASITPKIVENNTSTKEGEVKKEKISFFSLFRYSDITEKIMIILGLIGSIGQGVTMPIMIQVMGDLINVFVSLVASVTVRNITGIKDNDDLLLDFLGIALSGNQTALSNFFDSHNEIDWQGVMNRTEDYMKNNAEYFEQNNSADNEYDLSTLFMKKDDFWHDFRLNMLYLALIGILSFVASFLMDGFLSVSAMRQVTRIRSLTFKSIVKQEIAWHEKTSPGELASRIISDTILVEDGISFKLGMVIQSVVTFIACFILAFKSGWKLSLYMSIIIPILLIFVICMAAILKKYTKKTQDAYAELGGIAQEAFSQIRTIVSFGTEQKEIDRYVSKLEPTKKYGIIKGHAVGCTLGLVFGIVYASFSIAFILGTHYIRDKEMMYGDVLNVFMGIMMGAMMLSGVGVHLSAFSEATGAATILFDIIEKEPEIKLEGRLVPDKPTEGHIEFQDVHFNYPSRPDVEVLKGISFKCLPGQTVALVGASGSGKSTTVQLIERFYNKKSGRILIDGKDIEDYNVSWLRSQIGLVSQEPTLFDASVAKNISINAPNATQEQIEEAAKLANAHDFIKKLSNGYDTSTGERGLQLSGGQKQRICIARALINNPKILLLDEATSALDNQSEKIVQAALDSASSGRTTLVIAHRLSTIKNADLIIVMEKGIIIESGTHDELMKLQKYYYNLVKNQKINIEENEENENDEDEEGVSKDPDAIQQTQFVETTPHRETTILSRIASSISMSRRRTTGAFSEKSGLDGQPLKIYEIKDMEWKRYFDINKPFWLPILLGFIGALFNGGMQPAFAFIFSSALNVFTKQGDELIDGGLFWGMMFIVLGVCNFFAFYFNIGGFIISGEYLSYELRKRMYNNMVRQEVGFFDTNDIGDGSEKAGGQGPQSETTSTGTLTAKLATEAGLVNGLNTNIGQVFQQIVTVVGGFGIAFFNGWKLTLLLLIAVPFLFLGSALRMKAFKTKNQENRMVFEKSSKVATEAIVSIKTVYALNLSEYFRKLYDEKLYEPVKRLERRNYISAVGTGFSNAVAFFAYILGYWVGAIFIENGEMEFDRMFKVLMAIILTAMAVGQSSTIVSETQKAVEAFMHVLEIIDRKPKIDARDPNGIKKEPNDFKANIDFGEIRFRYPSRPKVTVLRMGDKKISVPAGKMCAFVGASGSGKSTIIGLVPRWYDVNHGYVKVDDIQNKDYNVKWLREQIGIVNQEPCLFNISIKDNIKYGKLDATDEEIYEAGRKANIHDFIMSLPDKYDTLVGGLGTSQMSGGQKQRVAIARAMVRNPKILLLDEATSALDAESELVVQKALEDASQGRTTITIAHRLSTIKDADIICVFRDGRIIEMGNHEELMEKKGEYYKMVLAGDSSIAKGNAIAKKTEAEANKSDNKKDE
ncbi:P-loop containing nucleoside triphosphate hydrolase protein [Anaeromyces robustus]|uniref:p-loop containing nucleoside triphosphate hydrolase protein n=1 Tax=Anaeromyces robustus TaxID=1754192 RepID=A0A1Y1WTK5_9FUNG|nr:P-loop containing nucleoside triphosphate hydrolase protein [Anaeromyces robustus]|eukprot:ORX76879.1 P-loop containing nucleoside triphosphate hydrolase protein [Anaeromyces robustus]